MGQSLAVKYRPKTFSDVSEQESVRHILEQQLKSGEIQHAYLFCGGAGTGKTTCARIFANELNKGIGAPIEIDAASNNSVNDVREIIQQSRMATLDGSRYRTYIIDECHSLSNSAWQAMLKLLEEPPETAVFIFCTTDPQKIPKTILSRVQRYDFQRISQKGIIDRLHTILSEEWRQDASYYLKDNALEYIARLCDGGMRDAITMLDKCLAYSTELTVTNVIEALGTADYDTMFALTDSLIEGRADDLFSCIETLHSVGKDLKQFIRSYTTFVLDMCKYFVTGTLAYTQIPESYKGFFPQARDHQNNGYVKEYEELCQTLLDVLVKLNAEIKWDTNPKAMIEATLFQFCIGRL